MVSPGLIEVAGPRLHIQPVAGLPLLHVEQPQCGDSAGSSGRIRPHCGLFVLAVLSPILLGLAAVVRLTSRGPALFFQTRGTRRQTFTMVGPLVYINAEDRLAELRERT